MFAGRGWRTLTRLQTPSRRHVAWDAARVARIVGGGEALLTDCHQLVPIDGLGVQRHHVRPVADASHTPLPRHRPFEYIMAVFRSEPS